MFCAITTATRPRAAFLGEAVGTPTVDTWFSGLRGWVLTADRERPSRAAAREAATLKPMTKTLGTSMSRGARGHPSIYQSSIYQIILLINFKCSE
jgi:hypothetical protein